MMYEVKGSFRIGDKYQPFNIKVNAVSENTALERVYSKIGSNHNCKRRFIKVESVQVAKEK
jgi:large subunit ribosomal protein LX